MALDRQDQASNLRNTQSDLTPHVVPRIIWTLIEPYLTKYGVQFVEAFPDTRVKKPTITWRIVRRVPGVPGSPYRTKRGANYNREVKTDEDGNIHSEYTQWFNIFYEFAIFGTSAAELDELAWDFETSIVDIQGSLETNYSGIKMVFSSESSDTSMSWRQQDEALFRTLTFEAIVPVRFIKVSPSVRAIFQEYRFGRLNRQERVDRTDTPTYTPTVDENEVVASINFIFITRDGSRKTLREGIDFYVRETDSHTFYLEWNDTYGLTPEVGENFVVDYDTAQKGGVETYKRDPGCPV